MCNLWYLSAVFKKKKAHKLFNLYTAININLTNSIFMFALYIVSVGIMVLQDVAGQFCGKQHQHVK